MGILRAFNLIFFFVDFSCHLEILNCQSSILIFHFLSFSLYFCFPKLIKVSFKKILKPPPQQNNKPNCIRCFSNNVVSRPNWLKFNGHVYLIKRNLFKPGNRSKRKGAHTPVFGKETLNVRSIKANHK